MIRLPIKYFVIEGTDLCGKSSLYASLHKFTQFKYNIQDRSTLSMLCYARHYGRDDVEHRAELLAELSDLNNFMVVLLPPIEEVVRRFHKRGDDCQDETSLRNLHKLFTEEVAFIEHMPNVMVIREIRPLADNTVLVAKCLSDYEDHADGRRQICQIDKWMAGMETKEAQLQARLVVDPMHSDLFVLTNPYEGSYYRTILQDCISVVTAEVAGANPYGQPQDLTSRRFYYNSSTCISSIHFLPRNGDLKVICTLRSTDVVKNGDIDLRFLAHLSAEVPRYFKWPVGKIELTVRWNSAHIRSDVV